jgi:DMSO/TMAO reductase YedYZ molybdopterin-dependent catalytic subunit
MSAAPGPTERLAALLRRPVPPPPDQLRRGPWRAGTFSSPLRSTRLTSQLGLALAVAFFTCFLTGLISHFIQHPAWWTYWPSRPVSLYRVTQGVHVATGIAIIPILGGKLWSVYPRLFTWPPVRDRAHAIERASIAVLVSAALFQVVTGLLDIALWYAPMPFFFTAAHYWTAWLVVGAILTHIGVKLPLIRAVLSRRTGPPRREAGSSASEAGHDALEARGDMPAAADEPIPLVAPNPVAGLTRRGLLTAAGAAVAAVTLATVGQTVRPLARVSVLAPRRPDIGPQGLPVNKSAASAGVVHLARDPAYRLVVAGPTGSVRLTVAELAAFPQYTVSLPITCVEGWSAAARWTGVRLRDLVTYVGGDADRTRVRARSLQTSGRYRLSVIEPPHLGDPLTLVALRLNGAVLHLDHGYPCRLIAPNRPGVLQTKWLAALTVEEL